MRNALLMLLALTLLPLAANPQYYPLTTLAEGFGASNDPHSDFAFQNLNAIWNQTNPEEFISCHFYHASGNLTTPSVENWISTQGVTVYPTVGINGNPVIIGNVPAGYYWNVVSQYLYQSSPLRMELDSFDSSTGDAVITVTSLDPDLAPGNYTLVWYLLENGVQGKDNVARLVETQSITLPPTGQQSSFNHSFSLDPAWNQSNLWMAASVRTTAQSAILQNVSSLPNPSHRLRAAMDWDPAALVAPPNDTFNSPTLWIFNTGESGNMTMQIVVDEEDVAADPLDWYFNYCDEEGGCYPGGQAMPLVLGAGEAKAFHLNLWVGSTGRVKFHFEINSQQLGTFRIPFVVRTTDYVGVSDELQAPSALRVTGNHPNPFRASTVFTVQAPKAAGQAVVQIYNSRGQKVDQVLTGNLRPGSNEVLWQVPAGLASGVYFYRLQGDASPARKMLLIK